MYLNEKEELIIGKFLSEISLYENKKIKLTWANNSFVIALLDTVFEDEDDISHEEYTSIVFSLLEIKGNPPINVASSNLFLINYKNFPSNIETF